MNTNKQHLEIKARLSGFQTLEDEMALREKIRPEFIDSADKLYSLPGDIAALAVSNDCIISGYVDFHGSAKMNKAKDNYRMLISSLERLF